MLIAVAGPYSAPTAEERLKNFRAMNEAAAAVYQKGHIPLIGVNAALPVVECAQPGDTDRYEMIMNISLAAISPCDALLQLADSPGVKKERALIEAKGGKIFFSVDEIPNASKTS